MNIPWVISTSHGPRRLPSRPMVRVALTHTELHRLACAVTLDAAEAERAGPHDGSERLFWRAADLREAGR